MNPYKLKGNRSFLLAAVLFGIFACPQYALANAGTPLMWATALHLFFGNFLIGLGEGLLLAWLFSASKLRCVLLMIVANYASAWIGGLFIHLIMQDLPLDLNNAWMWFWIMVGVTYVLTLVLEWPFIAYCLRGANWLKRSFRATLVLQTVSYVLLFGWYWGASGTSLYTDMNIVAPSEISLPESVLVYYIGSEDGDVYKRRLGQENAEMVFELNVKGQNARLFVRPSKSDATLWDLVARLDTAHDNNPQFVDVLNNLNIEVPVDPRYTENDTPPYDGSWFHFGLSPCLRIGISHWEFHTGGWPIEGLTGENKSTGESVHFAYETPFGAWWVHNAILLPSDIVLFELDKDQICAFDPATRRVSLLWHGRGAVAVIEKDKAKRDEPSQPK